MNNRHKPYRDRYVDRLRSRLKRKDDWCWAQPLTSPTGQIFVMKFRDVARLCLEVMKADDRSKFVMEFLKIIITVPLFIVMLTVYVLLLFSYFW